MDKFTQIANNFLNETLESTQNVLVEGLMMKIQKLAHQGKDTDAICKELGINDTKNARTAIDYIIKSVNDDDNHEDAENILSKDDERAIKLGTKLSTAVSGGVNPFNNPQKNINKALGKMYNKIANQLTKISKTV